MQNETYKRLLNQLPEEERTLVVNSLLGLITTFENNLIIPIKNFKNK